MAAQQELTIETYRRQYDEFFGRLPVDEAAQITKVVAGGVPAVRIRYRDDAARHILFLHGGGYICGNPEGAASVAALLAQIADATVVLPRYRLGPEHAHPAAVDDAVTAYRSMLGRGIHPSRITVVGESAGGGLALSAVIELVRTGLAPAALAVWSPLADLDLSAIGTKTNSGSDPMVTEAVLTMVVRAYLQGQDPRTPSASPLHADLTGLPPLLIQVGGRDALLDDATQLAECAKAAGVEVSLEICDGQPHVFQYLAAKRAVAHDAVARTAAFAVAHTC